MQTVCNTYWDAGKGNLTAQNTFGAGELTALPQGRKPPSWWGGAGCPSQELHPSTLGPSGQASPTTTPKLVPTPLCRRLPTVLWHCWLGDTGTPFRSPPFLQSGLPGPQSSHFPMGTHVPMGRKDIHYQRNELVNMNLVKITAWLEIYGPAAKLERAHRFLQEAQGLF